MPMVYVHNKRKKSWRLSYLHGVRPNCGQRSFLPVNRGVPQGTVLGPVLFTIMVNDIRPTSQNTLMTKYADDITCSIPVGPNVNDNASEEVENIKVWAEENLMKLNLSKTKELAIRGRTTLPPPEPIVTIERVSYLKLLGVTF